MKLVLCTACVAHGTSRTVNLARACQAQTAAGDDRHAPYTRQARLVARKMHPSRRDVPLRGLRPLRLVDSWRAGRVALAADVEEVRVDYEDGTSDPTPADQEAGTELQQLQALEEGYAQAAAAAHDYMDEDDDFGFEGMGQAAYEEAGSIDSASPQVHAPAAPRSAVPPAEPVVGKQVVEDRAKVQPAKRPRRTSPVRALAVVAADARGLPEQGGSMLRIAASFEAVEQRFSLLGEVPRFVVSIPRRLQHTCSSLDAVHFWTASLSWKVEGRQAAVVEAAFLAPKPPPAVCHSGRIRQHTQPLAHTPTDYL